MERSYWRETTKNGKGRKLRLGFSAVEALKRHKKRQAECLLSLGIGQGPETAIVTDDFGRPLSPSILRKRFSTFCGENGFHITPHGLRHTAAVAMLSTGVDVRTAAGRLGHQDGGRLLLKTYGHFVDEADRVAAEREDAACA